jgi:tetratricopeptide (TPR) repeat protein
MAMMPLKGVAFPLSSAALPNESGSKAIRDSEFLPLLQGTREIEHGNNGAALPYLIESLEQNPTNLIALFHLGNAYLELAKNADIAPQRSMFLRQAYQNFERVINLNGSLTIAYFKLGKVALMANDLDSARRYYELGLEADPKNAALVFNLARVHDQANDKDKAMTFYRQAIELDPTFVFAYNNLGLLYEDKKDWLAAERYYKQALNKDPDYTLSRINLGNLYATMGRYGAAEKQLKVAMYQHAVAINPEHPSLYYLMAIALSRLNRMDEAMQAGLRYVQLVPEGEFADEMKRLILSTKLSQSRGLTVMPLGGQK